MKNAQKVVQIAFTYIGTIVGAGFATGREVLQFFTQYGKWGTITIVLASILFIWLGTKMMLLAQKIKAESYEDLNRQLFGVHIGKILSFFTLIILIGVNSVMLAGAGSVFSEHLGMNYQTGLWITIISTFFLLHRGMKGIIQLNSIVVPLMLTISLVIIVNTIYSPQSANFITLESDFSMLSIWAAPLLYTSFNLSMSQAVLVPMGGMIENRKVIIWGGILGGIGIGFMLLAAHFALSSQMPGIMQYEIPMGNIARQLGHAIQLIYVTLIFMEIFSTFVADIYGVTLQLKQYIPVSAKIISIFILMICYTTSQFGFSSLLSLLYPIFGLFSALWTVLLIAYKSTEIPAIPKSVS